MDGPLDFQRRAVGHINSHQFFAWFLGLAIPFTLALGAFIGWHNTVVNPVQPSHLLMRAVIGAAGYSAIVVIIYVKVFRPAILKAQREPESSD